MKRPIYVVMHIPKTAGQTLQRNFKLNFPGPAFLSLYRTDLDITEGDIRPEYDWDAERTNRHILHALAPQTGCIFGHLVHAGVPQILPPGVEGRLITFLREPIGRCVSLYTFLRDIWKGEARREIVDNEWTLNDWLNQTTNLAWRDGQTRRLIWDTHPEVKTLAILEPRHLEAAKARLREFWFVGTTETFDEDTLFLYGHLGFRRFHPERVVNASQKAPLDEATRQRLIEANRLDAELYALARELRQRHAQQPGTRLQSRKARLVRGISLGLRAKGRNSETA